MPDVDDFYGSLSTYPCEVSPKTDGISIRRIGPAGSPHAAVAFTVFISMDGDELDGFEETDEDYLMGAAQVVLSTENTRRLIADLLAAADEADGTFTSLLDDGGGLEDA